MKIRKYLIKIERVESLGAPSVVYVKDEYFNDSDVNEAKLFSDKYEAMAFASSVREGNRKLYKNVETVPVEFRGVF